MKTNITHKQILLVYGAYTGDGTADRIIPHNLKRVPRLIFIVNRSNYQQNNGAWEGATFRFSRTSDNSSYTVSVPQETYFCVGNAAGLEVTSNANGVVYDWVAI